MIDGRDDDPPLPVSSGEVGTEGSNVRDIATDNRDRPIGPEESGNLTATPVLSDQGAELPAELERDTASPVSVGVEAVGDAATADCQSGDHLLEVLLPPTAPVEFTTHQPGDRIRFANFDLEIRRAHAGGWFEATDGRERYLFRHGATYWRWDREHPLLPTVTFVGNEGVILRAVEGTRLVAPLPFGDAIAIAAAIAQLVRFFEAQRLAVLDIDPDALIETASGLCCTVPPRVTPLGAPSPITFREGFTAPEARVQAVATGREGVYAVGALLHYLLTGKAVPPEGLGPVALGMFPLPGLPQLLARLLSEDASARPTPQQLTTTLRELGRSVDADARRVACPTFDIAIVTTIGLNPDRQTNEDAAGYIELRVADGAEAQGMLVACVSDGMGGAEAGEVASRAAVRAFCRVDIGLSTRGLAEQIAQTERLAWDANSAVLEALEGRDGGCTLTGVLLVGDCMTMAHVGDSRAYLRNATGLRQLTRDHSLVAALVASGAMTPQEAESSPDRSTILRSMGSVRQPQVGYVDGIAVQTGEECLRLGIADTLLLCSDGVWGEVSESVIDEVLVSAARASEAAKQLVLASIEAGAPDNATAVVVRRI